MEKFEVLTIINLILLIAFFYILYKIFIHTQKVQGKRIALIVTVFIFIIVPKNCQSKRKDNLKEIINEVALKKEIRKKYKIFELKNKTDYTFQSMNVSYLVYFDEDNKLQIFDESVIISGLVLGTMFDELPVFTNVQELSNGSYHIISYLSYYSFFFSGNYTTEKTYSAKEIKEMSSIEGRKYFIHYPKFEEPSYRY